MFLWQLNEAQSRLDEIATASLAGPQYITLNKDDAVVIMNAKHYRLLKYSAALNSEGFIDRLMSAPKSELGLEFDLDREPPRDADFG